MYDKIVQKKNSRQYNQPNKLKEMVPEENVELFQLDFQGNTAEPQQHAPAIGKC